MIICLLSFFVSFVPLWLILRAFKPLADRVAVGQHRHGAAGAVEEAGAVVVDAQVRKTVAHRSFGVSGRSFGSSAFDVVQPTTMPVLHAAADDELCACGQWSRPGCFTLVWVPMEYSIARRAAELAGHDQQHRRFRPRAYRSSISADTRLIEEAELVPRVVEDVAVDRVRIPVVAVVQLHRLAGRRRVLQHHRDEAGPVLDQPPRHAGPAGPSGACRSVRESAAIPS